MKRTTTGLLPLVEAMEPRWLLSTATPLLSRQAMNGVIREVKAIVGELARTSDTVQASSQLSGLSGASSVGIGRAHCGMAERPRALPASFSQFGRRDQAADSWRPSPLC